jgi:Fis family transcriptional regulator
MRDELDALISQMYKGGILYVEAVREFRKAFIATVLRENNGNQSHAARELGMHRNTLSRVVSVLELDVRALRPGSRRPPAREPSLSVARKMSR